MTQAATSPGEPAQAVGAKRSQTPPGGTAGSPGWRCRWLGHKEVATGDWNRGIFTGVITCARCDMPPQRYAWWENDRVD